MYKRKIFRLIIIYILLIFTLILFISPLYAAVSFTFKSMKELAVNRWGLPQVWQFKNFKDVFMGTEKITGIKGYFLNTFKIAIPAVIISIFLSSLVAYPLAKLKVKGANIIFFIFLFGLTIPHQILIIPVFKILNLFHLYDTIIGLIWIHCAFSIPFCTFVLKNFMLQIPDELIDAAKIDGCGILRTYWSIIIPLSKSVLAVLVILVFTGIYNDFFFGLILTHSDSVTPVIVRIAFFKSESLYAVRWDLQSAAALIASVPTLVVFLAFQRYFMKGIMLGSVKE